MHFSIYYLEEAISFEDASLLNKRPLKTRDTFHSQFQLKSQKYLDNNN